MTSDVPSVREDNPYRPACPFCGADWTEAMLEQLDSMTVPTSCSCCVGALGGSHWPLPPPTSDLCCASCGRAIYRKL